MTPLLSSFSGGLDALEHGRPDARRAGDVDLKLGIYSGPCFAVTANGVLDYFGQTVNVAARLQAQAEAGDLVLPEDLAEAAAAGGWLAGTHVSERYAATLKGIDEPVRVVRVRWRPSGEPQREAFG